MKVKMLLSAADSDGSYPAGAVAEIDIEKARAFVKAGAAVMLEPDEVALEVADLAMDEGETVDLLRKKKKK